MNDINQSLLEAVDAGDLDSAKAWFARHPGRVDEVRDEAGRTPLHRAAATDNCSLAALIEETMRDPYARDAQGLLPMDYPPGERETAARRILRKIVAGQQKWLARMLEPRKEVPGTRILAESIDKWRRIARHRLLPTGETALMLACEANRPDVVTRRIKNDADVKHVDWLHGWSALNYAIDADAGDCLAQLMAADSTTLDFSIAATVDELPACLTPLHIAAWTGKPSCVDLLLRNGANVDARASGDRHAWTPLHLAALAGNLAIVERLVAAGADATLAEGCEGFNALQLAMKHKHEPVISALQTWGKDRGVNLQPFFERDPHGMAATFPLYQAPVRVARGCCTICKQEKPVCLGVHSLVAACPSCEKPRTWEVEQANEITRCEWCERQAEWPSDWPRERQSICVCVDCLRDGHAAISHATDFGSIHPKYSIKGMVWGSDRDVGRAEASGFATTVLKEYEDGSQSIGIHLPKPLIDDLMRTPRHPTLQEEHWTFHCGGWMVYLGKWDMQDFERQAPGRAAEWFAEHFNEPEDAEMVWDWFEGDMGWSCVFNCPRCGAFKVFYDVT